MKLQGRVTNWNDDKGFGFVEPNGGGKRSFVHIKSFDKPSRRPSTGDLIVYEELKEKNGKYKAINIVFASVYNKQKNTHKTRPLLGIVATLPFLIILAITFLGKLIPVEIVYLYVTASIVTFLFYACDKKAAKNNLWRTPESHLHLLSAIGGWPGAFFAQTKLRHKSTKKEFKQVYWATVVINICAFFWLLSEKGQLFLETIGS